MISVASLVFIDYYVRTYVHTVRTVISLRTYVQMYVCHSCEDGVASVLMYVSTYVRV